MIFPLNKVARFSIKKSRVIYKFWTSDKKMSNFLLGVYLRYRMGHTYTKIIVVYIKFKCNQTYSF